MVEPLHGRSSAACAGVCARGDDVDAFFFVERLRLSVADVYGYGVPKHRPRAVCSSQTTIAVCTRDVYFSRRNGRKCDTIPCSLTHPFALLVVARLRLQTKTKAHTHIHSSPPYVSLSLPFSLPLALSSVVETAYFPPNRHPQAAKPSRRPNYATCNVFSLSSRP